MEHVNSGKWIAINLILEMGLVHLENNWICCLYQSDSGYFNLILNINMSEINYVMGYWINRCWIVRLLDFWNIGNCINDINWILSDLNYRWWNNNSSMIAINAILDPTYLIDDIGQM